MPSFSSIYNVVGEERDLVGFPNQQSTAADFKYHTRAFGIISSFEPEKHSPFSNSL